MSRADIIKQTKWTCGCCGAEMLRQRSTIRSHLKKRHMKNIDDYNPAESKPDELAKSEENRPEISDTPAPSQVTRRNNTASKMRMMGPFDPTGGAEWWRGCLYRCGHCNKKFHDTSFLRTHLRVKHGAEYFLDDDDVLVSSTWDCPKCGKTMLRQRSTIRHHLLAAHGVTLRELLNLFPSLYGPILESL